MLSDRVRERTHYLSVRCGKYAAAMQIRAAADARLVSSPPLGTPSTGELAEAGRLLSELSSLLDAIAREARE